MHSQVNVHFKFLSIQIVYVSIHTELIYWVQFFISSSYTTSNHNVYL